MTQVSQHPAVRLVEIRDEALGVHEVIDALDDVAAGGLTLFVGRVRDHDGGQGVTSLDYSAHPTALERLHDVCDRIAAEHDVHGLAAVHRVGHLEIGDVAVIVATTASHRDAANATSRWLAVVATITATSPISR